MSARRMTPRERALYEVQTHAFAAKEAQLYLDTHPDDCEAFRELRRQTEREREAAARYQDRYGPLTVAAAAEDDAYRWTDGAWPWEGEA